jgi:hypothetical protein
MPRALTTFTATLIALLAAARGIPACLDVTPIVLEKEASATPTDFPCLRCLQRPDDGGGCSDEIAICQNDPRCNAAYACIVAKACLDLPTIDDKIQCGLPCAQEAGVTSLTDPVVGEVQAVVLCGEQGCADPCHVGDAGFAFDGS